VLIFAIVLLVLLAALGTAFVMYVRQARAAATNAFEATQAQRVQESGLAFALKHIRAAMREYVFVSPDGIFVPDVSVGYLNSDPAPVVGQPANLYRLFEAYPGQLTVQSTLQDGTASHRHAWLWWNADDGFHNCTEKTFEPAIDPLYFTDAKLAVFAEADGRMRKSRATGPEHAGLARRIVLDADQDGLAEFYNTATSTALPRATWKSGEHGEFYIWIQDLDGMLHADPKKWGMDATFDFSATETAQQAAKTMLGSLVAHGKMDTVTATEIDKVWTRTTPYNSCAEIWEQFGLVTPASGSGLAAFDYYNSRYGLDRYFSPRRDVELTSLDMATYQAPFASIKETETALNVNTASFETVAAALSRIPLVDGYEAANHADLGPIPAPVVANTNKASFLAARVCAKRPFLCRVDFEDFLAAHLNSPALAADDYENDPTLPACKVYKAIPKRASRVLPDYVMPSLEALTEVPGITDAHLIGTVLRDPLEQQKRFAFFREDDAQAPLVGALISVKAFNNLLNSLSGKKRDGTYGYSYYSSESKRIPFDGTADGKPKFEYKELADAAMGTGKYFIDDNQPAPDSAGELQVWRATNASGYYEMTFSNSDDVQLKEYGKSYSGTFAGERIDFITTGGIPESPNWPNDLVDGTGIYESYDGATPVVCNSTVHGPLRAYRNRENDSKPPPEVPLDESAQLPTAGVAIDVSWSPRFTFRSRFFCVYVLSRALNANGQPYAGGTRRIEAVYDALKDRVLWQRQPQTYKRSLGDPEP